ncbi:MAG: hypothetical protein R3F56_01015 [Planctomycetota bacterium]
MQSVVPLFALAVGLAAQAGDHVIVAVHGNPVATSLFDVDLASGSVQAIGRFGLDGFPPLAITVDQVNRDVVVALQTPASTSVLVRLRLAGATVVQSASLGDVPGTASALTQALDGRFVTTTDAGVYTTERNGSVARRVATLAQVSAIETFGLATTQAVVAQSGSTTTDPQVRWIDLVSGRTIAGPWVYAGYTPRGITGVADLPTGAARQVLSHDDGTIAISVNFALPVPLPLVPVLPPGATAAMHVRGLEGIVLGGSAHPFLKSFQALGGTQWTMLAGPLPGDPVDFAFRPTSVAATVSFGGSCNRMLLAQATAGGDPRLGNSSYGLQLTFAAPSSLAVLALGASDQRFVGVRLPLALPGGCLALAGGDLVVPTTTSGLGDATITLGIPSSAALVGAIAYAQWLQPAAGGLDSSNAGAIWIDM